MQLKTATTVPIIGGWIIFALWVCAWSGPAYADLESPASFRVAVIVSYKIRPYLEALDGIETTLKASENIETDVFFLNRSEEDNSDAFRQKLEQISFNGIIAVGPEAAVFAWQTFPDDFVIKLFSMVLNPHKLNLARYDRLCGVSLNISASDQVRVISRAMPGVKTIGLLFDPAQNIDFYQSALFATRELDVILVPLTVTSRKDLTTVLSSHWSGIDLLWLVPDHTVITESLVKYMIKKGISKRVPVAGYNRFFYQSGACIAFVTDYRETGRKTAAMLTSVLGGGSRCIQGPFFETWVNERVLKKIGKPFADDPMRKIRRGP